MRERKKRERMRRISSTDGCWVKKERKELRERNQKIERELE